MNVAVRLMGMRTVSLAVVGAWVFTLAPVALGDEAVNPEALFRRFAVQDVVKPIGESRLVIDRPDTYRIETDAEFAGRVRAARRRTNFSGSFSIVRWSCGFICTSAAIVEVKTGALRWFPFQVGDCQAQKDQGLHFSPDSRLLVVKGVLHSSKFPEVELYGTYYFEWTGRQFRRLTESDLRDGGPPPVRP